MKFFIENVDAFMFLYAVAVSVAGFLQSLSLRNIKIRSLRTIKLLTSFIDRASSSKILLDPHYSEQKACGTSTGLALSTIGKAMLFPNKFIKIKDHHKTAEADKCLLNTVIRLIDHLELKNFTINLNKLEIMYRLKK